MKQRFEALDGLRGLAALMVLGHHVETSGFHSTWMARGYLAVDLFFGLSGFVIAAAYERRMNADPSVLRSIRSCCSGSSSA